MKLYRSLLFREWKISRRHYVTRVLMVVCFAALLLLAVFAAWKDDFANASASELEELRSAIDMFGMMFGMLTAILAVYDTDVLQSDVNCGWHRYSLALPITAKDKALARYSVRCGAILTGGILCGIFAVIIENPLGQQLFAGTLNVYCVTLDVLLLFELLRSLLMTMGLTEKQAGLAVLLFIVFVVCGFVIWFCLSYLDDFWANISEMTENGINPATKLASDVVETAENLSFVPFIVLILLTVCSFFASAKALERREP